MLGGKQDKRTGTRVSVLLLKNQHWAAGLVMEAEP